MISAKLHRTEKPQRIVLDIVRIVCGQAVEHRKNVNGPVTSWNDPRTAPEGFRLYTSYVINHVLKMDENVIC